jgi:hypothetical protein
MPGITAAYTWQMLTVVGWPFSTTRICIGVNSTEARRPGTARIGRRRA